MQRVSKAEVSVRGEVIGSIERGLCAFLGIHAEDGPEGVERLVDKLLNLRIFCDSEGKMNRSLKQVEGGLLIISQFTLYGDCSRGRRPEFTKAARPEAAEPLYERFVEQARLLFAPVETGRFGAEMEVSLVNEGPVTLLLEGK